MTLVDAQQIGRSYDCASPGCTGETDRPGGLCRTCQTTGVHPAPLHVAPGSLAHLNDDDHEEAPVADPDAPVLCRIDGCGRESVAQTGPWKGWCADHKHLRGKRTDKTAAAPAKPSPPRTKEPAAAPTPLPPGPLTALAQTCDQTALALAQARQRHQDAVDALRAALDAA